MITTGSIAELRDLRWANFHDSWGLVPTMGYLHEGHLSLVRRARAENDKVAVTLFVNPTQFAPNEDLASYPRSLERDTALLETQGADLLFVPDDSEMYPPGFQSTVNVVELSRSLEGAARSSHFVGVTTVVTKLFNIVQPQRAYFGQKDAQQTVVLRQMVRDLNFNLEIVVCPTVREADGLAMSSRNSYLSRAERQAAVVIYQALRKGQAAIEEGERDGNILRRIVTAVISAEPLARVDYVSVADPFTLEELGQIEDRALLSTAVFFGNTRLIDNLLVDAASQ